MTDFQVGDRVSVEGVVTSSRSPGGDVFLALPWVQFQTPSGTLIQLRDEELKLIERPKRKLRVGSVWEHNYLSRKAYVIGQRAGADLFVPLDGLGVPLLRSQTNFDTRPQDWREVPVEELEREAEK